MNAEQYKEFLKSEIQKLDNLNSELPIYMFADTELKDKIILEVGFILLDNLKTKKTCAYIVEDQSSKSRWTVLDLTQLLDKLANESIKIIDKIEIVFVGYLG